MRNVSMQVLDPILKDKLAQLEKVLHADLWVTSALRTEEHNAAIGGAEESQHVDWDKDGDTMAVDIARSSFKQSPEYFKAAALALGFTGVGFYDTHVHVDVRENNYDPVVGYAFWDKRSGTGRYDKDKQIVQVSGSAVVDGVLTAADELIEVQRKSGFAETTMVVLFGVALLRLLKPDGKRE